MFEWGPWSLFAPPLNTWHRLINGARQPVKFLAVTNAPLMMDTIHSEEYIFNCPYVFSDRYSGADGYFNVGQKRYESGMQHIWETNFIMDIQVGESGPARSQRRGSAHHAIRAFGKQFDRPSGAVAGRALSQGALSRRRRDSIGIAVIGLRLVVVEGARHPTLSKRATAKMWSRSNGKPAAFTAHPEDGFTSTSIPARNRRAISRCATAAAFIRSDSRSPTSAARTASIST